MHITAHISDLHIDDKPRSLERASRVMDYLNGLVAPIDAILVTGDIADHGDPAEYAIARRLLTSEVPILDCPGNHDIRAAYRVGMHGELAADTPVNRVGHIGGVTYLLCDSTIPGRDDGLLDETTFGWLEQVLAEYADTATYVCFHHPPATLGSFVDEVRQRGGRRLARLLAAHPQVVAVLAGHVHTPAATTFASRPLLMAPGVVSTSNLPWESTELIDRTKPPMVAFHLLDDDRRVTTHYRVAV